MKSFTPQDLPLRQRHQYIIGAVGPRPICWASTVDKNGNPNLAPYSFFGAFGANPPILVFSSNRRGRDNTTKDTLHNIESTKEVVINIVSHDLVNQMNISSTDYPSEVNEFEKAGVTQLKSDIVKPFRVAESKVQFECKINDIVYTGNKGGAANLFICEIVKMHIDESILDEDEQINPYALDLVGRMGKNYYVRANEKSIFEINNPFDKQNVGFDALPKHVRESNILTGNEIAQMAMISALPTKEEITVFAERNESYINVSKEEKHKKAQLWISRGKIETALKLLMTI